LIRIKVDIDHAWLTNVHALCTQELEQRVASSHAAARDAAAACAALQQEAAAVEVAAAGAAAKLAELDASKKAAAARRVRGFVSVLYFRRICPATCSHWPFLFTNA